MSRFLGRLELEEADGTDDGQWLLERPLTYESDVACRTFTVPARFRTDLASVPRLPIAYWLCGGAASKAAVVHDFLYATRPVARRIADAVLREASAVTGVPVWRRWLMWAGVRAFGWIYWRA
ncbi:DUF1353 domain-containing protein [Bordetella bronchialis]|uniref:DUF1353 domain-containing protein n=1 Tax=Bordetella bronchialis TaxID=463025 RepID=A0A193FT49_9BORD|nr:DUF1353 domain-containing protein [Bordetella bronchialis]ANN70932.1 hypothetical protein BAU08_05920 [Bordetella bronchialis]